MKRSLSALLPYAVFLILALVSWNRWIEPYVDSGRELMVPRRVSRGEALYRDVHFHHGPLAPYAGALLERLAGRRLAPRIALAALLALLHLEALRRLAARWLVPGRDALAAALAVALAFFLRPGGWLFPFSFDTAIAVAAVTWGLVFAAPGTRKGDLRTAFCLLAALLSRLELGLAAIVVLALEARARPRRLRLLALLPVAATALAYAGLSIGTPLPTLVSDGWLALLHPPEAFRNVYRTFAGLDRPGFRLVELALAAALLLLIAALLAVAAAMARLASSRPRMARAVRILPPALLGATALLALGPPASLAETFSLFPPLVRVVPLALVGAAISRLVGLLLGRAPGGVFAGVADSVLFMAALFGARLLLAAGYAGPFNAFFLPLPAVVACAALWRGAEMAAPRVGHALPALLSSALAVFLVFRLLVLTDAYRRPGWTRVATPAGSLVLPEPVAATTRLALRDLERRIAPRGSLAGFPEAGFFNYVLDLENPLPLEQFFPGHLDAAGESRIIARLESKPPDAVVLINVHAVGEGARAFGKDYLLLLDRTIHRDFAS
ncbi:MAG TPA: hypothetical protein VK416_04330, partial [Thermoanaerobaculia bacterium]|nr:hypothetical protein [Thermoanaerobaculia bacterium]